MDVPTRYNDHRVNHREILHDLEHFSPSPALAVVLAPLNKVKVIVALQPRPPRLEYHTSPSKDFMCCLSFPVEDVFDMRRACSGCLWRFNLEYVGDEYGPAVANLL